MSRMRSSSPLGRVVPDGNLQPISKRRFLPQGSQRLRKCCAVDARASAVLFLMITDPRRV